MVKNKKTPENNTKSDTNDPTPKAKSLKVSCPSSDSVFQKPGFDVAHTGSDLKTSVNEDEVELSVAPKAKSLKVSCPSSDSVFQKPGFDVAHTGSDLKTSVNEDVNVYPPDSSAKKVLVKERQGYTEGNNECSAAFADNEAPSVKSPVVHDNDARRSSQEAGGCDADDVYDATFDDMESSVKNDHNHCGNDGYASNSGSISEENNSDGSIKSSRRLLYNAAQVAKNALVGLDEYGVPIEPNDVHVMGANGRAMIGRYKFTSLAYLESMDAIFEPTMCLALLVQVLDAKTLSSDKGNDGRPRKMVFNRMNNTEKINPFTKAIFVRCLRSDPGSNVGVILLNPYTIDLLYGSSLRYRDIAHLSGPGGYYLILSPSHVSSYFGSNVESGVPILSVENSLKIVDVENTFMKPKVYPFLSSAPRTHSFYFPKVKFTLLRGIVSRTSCVGTFCDSVGLKKGINEWNNVCPCFQSVKRGGRNVLDLTLKGEVQGHNIHKDNGVFIASCFTSRSFTESITTEGIPVGMSPSEFDAGNTTLLLHDHITKLFNKINENGGFSALGWVRAGRVNEQGTSSAGGGNGAVWKASQPTVWSSNLTCHLTNVKINCKRDKYENALVDVRRIYLQNVEY